MLLFLGIGNYTNADNSNLGVIIDSSSLVYNAPIIVRSKNVTTESLDIVVGINNAFAGRTLRYLVTVKNKFTGVVATSLYTKIVNVAGEVDLSIIDIEPNTRYELEVQYAPIGGAYSEKSGVFYTETSAEAPSINTIDNITEDAVDLEIVGLDRFIGTKVDFIIEVDKKGEGPYTIQFTKYISSKYTTLTIDNLNTHEDYTFRVKYSREGLALFSTYSEEKTATTRKLKIVDIIDVKNITTDSVTLVVKTNKRAGEKLNFRIKAINKETGKIVIIELIKIVRGNNKVSLHVSGLNHGNRYEFVVKYSPKTTNKYSEYSMVRSVETKDIKNGDKVLISEVEICHENTTLIISRERLQEYLNKGAMIGDCMEKAVETKDDIRVCYEKKEIFITNNELQTYIDNGAIKGDCENSSQIKARVEVCYNNETVWTSINSQVYRESILGSCDENEKNYKNKFIQTLGQWITIILFTFLFFLFFFFLIKRRRNNEV